MHWRGDRSTGPAGTSATDPKVPAFAGGKFPLSTYLAARVRDLLSDPKAWRPLPAAVIVRTNGTADLIRRRDSYEDLLTNDVW